MKYPTALDKMPNSKERELVESTFNRKTENKVEEQACHPTSKNYYSELFLTKRTAGTKMEKKLRKNRSNNLPSLESISRGGTKA